MHRHRHRHRAASRRRRRLSFVSSSKSNAKKNGCRLNPKNVQFSVSISVSYCATCMAIEVIKAHVVTFHKTRLFGMYCEAREDCIHNKVKTVPRVLGPTAQGAASPFHPTRASCSPSTPPKPASVRRHSFSMLVAYRVVSVVRAYGWMMWMRASSSSVAQAAQPRGRCTALARDATRRARRARA